jgi:beta-glucosidase
LSHHTPSLWPSLQSELARDPDIEAAVESLLGQMSLAQKVGQVTQAEIRDIRPEEVKTYHIGSVLNGGGAWPDGNMRSPVEAWVALADAYYEASMDTSGGAPGEYLAIPVLWGTDAVHGHSNVFGATLFPHNIGLGAARDPEMIERIGRATAREVAATGIDWTFAPTLAAARDDRWGRTYESYAETGSVIRSYAGAMVRGLQGTVGERGCLGPEQVLATAKHFLADGGTLDGVDQGDAVIDESTLIRVHAQGYFTSITAGVQTVMASFSSWNGEKLHGHHYLLTDILRGRLGFDGLVVGDWNGHGQLPDSANDHGTEALLAGVDLIMVPSDWKAFIANTLEDVRTGKLPESRLDEAVRRILRVKMRAGLLGPTQDRGAPSTRPLASEPGIVGCGEHRALAREAGRKSLVLLKNNGHTLPLPLDARLLIAGRGAHDIGMQSGGWTLTWQGTETSRDDFPHAQSIFEGFRDFGDGETVLSEDGALASADFDAIVAVIGESPYAEGQGDIRKPQTIEHTLRHPEDLALLERLRRSAPGVPIVTVFLSGRPLYANAEINRSDAFVAAWLPGGEGGCIAEVLFGEHDFHGRLTFTWPSRDTDSSLNRGDDGEALFPYGFGLTYRSVQELPQLHEERSAADTARELALFVRGAPSPGVSLTLESAGEVAPLVSSATTPHLQATPVDGLLQESARRCPSVRSARPPRPAKPLSPRARLRAGWRSMARAGRHTGLAARQPGCPRHWDLAGALHPATARRQLGSFLHALGQRTRDGGPGGPEMDRRVLASAVAGLLLATPVGAGGRRCEDAPVSEKRGAAYHFCGWEHSLGTTDLAAVDHGLSWVYNWSSQPMACPDGTGVAEALANGPVEFVPMAWGLIDGGSQCETGGPCFRVDERSGGAICRPICEEDSWSMHPDGACYACLHEGVDRPSFLDGIPANARYLLGYNEPNFKEQANLTPAAAAAGWRHLEWVADQRELSLVGPATNFCDPTPGVVHPGACIEAVDGRRMFGLAWLETFYDACTAEGPAGIDCRIEHQAVHAYSCDSVTWMVDLMKAKAGLVPSPEAHCTNGVQDEDEFGTDCGGNFCVACSAGARAHFAKPVWLTEFAPEAGSCGTDDPAELAARSLAFAERELAALDADPYVFRYAWFMPKTDIPSLDHVDLLDPTTPGARTRLGELYLGEPCPEKRRNRRRSAR